MSDHLSPEATLFLVALDDADPEKVAALQHTEGCVECQLLWSESTEMLELLDHEALTLPEIEPQLAARIERAVYPRRRARWPFVAWAAGALCSGLLAWLDAQPGAIEASLGFHCLRFEQAFGLAAFAAGALWSGRIAKRFGPVPASVAAMGGALIGQVLLRSRCEAAHAGLHLLAFHVAGVLLATLLGAAAGGVLVRARAGR
jgi:hypothetical protein